MKHISGYIQFPKSEKYSDNNTCQDKDTFTRQRKLEFNDENIAADENFTEMIEFKSSSIFSRFIIFL